MVWPTERPNSTFAVNLKTSSGLKPIEIAGIGEKSKLGNLRVNSASPLISKPSFVFVSAVNSINLTNEIIDSDVYTSGLGNNMPSGLYIGKISEIKKDKYNLSNKITIKLNEDINDFNIVSVVGQEWLILLV